MNCTHKKLCMHRKSNDRPGTSCSESFNKTYRHKNINCHSFICFMDKSSNSQNCCMSDKINGILNTFQYFHHWNTRRSIYMTCSLCPGIALLRRCILYTQLQCLCTLDSCSYNPHSLVGMFLACIHNFLCLSGLCSLDSSHSCFHQCKSNIRLNKAYMNCWSHRPRTRSNIHNSTAQQCSWRHCHMWDKWQTKSMSSICNHTWDTADSQNRSNLLYTRIGLHYFWVWSWLHCTSDRLRCCHKFHKCDYKQSMFQSLTRVKSIQLCIHIFCLLKAHGFWWCRKLNSCYCLARCMRRNLSNKTCIPRLLQLSNTLEHKGRVVFLWIHSCIAEGGRYMNCTRLKSCKLNRKNRISGTMHWHYHQNIHPYRYTVSRRFCEEGINCRLNIREHCRWGIDKDSWRIALWVSYRKIGLCMSRVDLMCSSLSPMLSCIMCRLQLLSILRMKDGMENTQD